MVHTFYTIIIYVSFSIHLINNLKMCFCLKLIGIVFNIRNINLYLRKNNINKYNNYKYKEYKEYL